MMGLTIGFWIIVITLKVVLTNFNSAYFTQIYKPPFYPPQFVFPLVWSFVYIALITSTVLAVIKNKEKNLIAAIIFNGILIALWPLFFFTLRSKLSGVLVLLLLILSAISLFKILFKTKSWYAYLIIPYLLWLLFLIALNYSILMIN